MSENEVVRKGKYSEQELIRIGKLNDLETLGIDPFGGKFDIKNYSETLKTEYEEVSKEELAEREIEVAVAGRIMTKRGKGKAGFMHIQDNDGQIQIYLRKDQLSEVEFTLFDKCDIGDIVGILGIVFKTNTGEVSIKAKKYVHLTKSLKPLPEKFHGLNDEEMKLRKRYLDIITNRDVKEIFLKKQKFWSTVRNFLIENDRKTTRLKSHVEMVGDVASVKLHLVSFNEYQLFIKRIIDISIGSVGFLIFLILYVVLGILIKLDSKGPVLFKQDRIGKHGRIFKIYKFRTMTVDAEEKKKFFLNKNHMNGPIFKMKNDPRITRIGKILRKTSLDEFPQFYNVLRGDMSLVGTRPPTIEEVKEYTNNEYQRIAIVPGITGIWQINGRSKITNFDDILKMETDYINRWNIFLDLIIIFKTIKVVILCEGAE